MVVSALDTATGKRLAIKKCANLFVDPVDARKIGREIRIMSQLNHPNIIKASVPACLSACLPAGRPAPCASDGQTDGRTERDEMDRRAHPSSIYPSVFRNRHAHR